MAFEKITEQSRNYRHLGKNDRGGNTDKYQCRG